MSEIKNNEISQKDVVQRHGEVSSVNKTEEKISKMKSELAEKFKPTLKEVNSNPKGISLQKGNHTTETAEKGLSSQKEMDHESGKNGDISFTGGMSASNVKHLTGSQKVSRANELRSEARRLESQAQRTEISSIKSELRNEASSKRNQADFLEKEGKKMMNEAKKNLSSWVI